MAGEEEDIGVTDPKVDEAAEAAPQPEEPEDEDAAEEDAEEDAGDDEADEAEDAGASARSRSTGRIQRQQAELKKAREEAAQVKAELEAFRARQAEQEMRLAQQQELEATQYMTPEEKNLYDIKKGLERQAQELQTIKFQSHDMADKTAYQALAATNKTYAKYQDEVEKNLADMRRQGTNVPRQVILEVLVGRDVLAGTKTAVTKQRAQGQDRIKAAQGRSVSGNGDAGRSGGGKSLEEKLSNVFI